jgi:hypothetical protein
MQQERGFGRGRGSLRNSSCEYCIDRLADVVDTVKLNHHLAAEWCQFHGSPALEQRLAQLVLELLHRVGHRGLGDAAALRCTGKGQLFANSDCVLYLSELQEPAPSGERVPLRN